MLRGPAIMDGCGAFGMQPCCAIALAPCWRRAGMQCNAVFKIVQAHLWFAKPHVAFLCICSGWKPVNDGNPIDRRKARGNWCNVKGAGLGERPRASPLPQLPMLDAYMWIKPPGARDDICLASSACSFQL